MDKPHQRKGSKSNSDVGARFEEQASNYFHKQGIELNNPFPLEVGVKGRTKKAQDNRRDSSGLLLEYLQASNTKGC
jgi:hypothetical protein